MRQVTCDRCRNRVLVEKYSPIHLSVQWLRTADTVCPEFAAAAQHGQDSACISDCHSLRRCIDAAARDGRIPESRFTEPGPLPDPDTLS